MGSYYTSALITDIGDFYHRENATEHVLRLFCREFVLALYNDMFLVFCERRDV